MLWLLVLFGLLLPLYGFAALAEDVWLHEAFLWDQRILTLLHGFQTPTLDRVALIVTFFGSGGLMALLGAAYALVLWRRHQPTRALYVALGIVGAGALDLLAKIIFQRVRPHLWDSSIRELGFSFPSGHAMGSMALVAVLIVLKWHSPWRWWTVILGSLFALTIGLSRLYLGVHYPSDVLAGWGAAIAWVTGISLIFRHLGRVRGE